MRSSLITLVLATVPLQAQESRYASEFAGEFQAACHNVVQLAEATPESKYAWRPAEGIRSFSEVYTHVAGGSYMLLGKAGVKRVATAQVFPDVSSIRRWEKEILTKNDVIALLRKSCEAVVSAWNSETPQRLERRVEFFESSRTVQGVYLRMLAHVNEHMGQLVAYARINDIRPPWAAR